MSMDSFRGLVRDVPDFPEPGVVFKDITPLLGNSVAFAQALEALAAPYVGEPISSVVGIEARGFIFGAPLASLLDASFVPVRKPGKLPWHVATQEYSLEYGTDALEVHKDAFDPSDHVLIVDDVLATGGTARATVALVQGLGASVAGVAVLIELGFLSGRAQLDGIAVHSVMHYDGS